MVWYRIHAYSSATYPSYKSYGFRNSPDIIWGHRGQIIIFTKNAISPTDYMVCSCDLMHIDQVDTLCKIYGSKIHPQSFGVTWIKRSFSPKVLFLLHIKWYGPHAYASARCPLQK